VPETKGVPLESMHLLFEGDIINGCIRDTVPRYSRAKQLQHHRVTDDASVVDGEPGKGAVMGVQHIEDA
jgi:SP family sugar:H+ symporter-like MFS transporter